MIKRSVAQTDVLHNEMTARYEIVMTQERAARTKAIIK